MEIKRLSFILIVLLNFSLIMGAYGFTCSPNDKGTLFKANFFKSLFSFDSSAYYFNVSYLAAISQKKYSEAAQIEISLAELYYKSGLKSLALERLEIANTLSRKNKLLETEIYAKYCDLLGKIYFDANSPEMAFAIWNKSFFIRSKLYIASDIRLVRSYVNFLSYYYILIDIGNSIKTIKTVELLLDKNKNKLDSIDLPEVYNALARSTKMATTKGNHFEKYKKARGYLTSAIAVVQKKLPLNYLEMGKLYHTLANTYVDEVGYYTGPNNSVRISNAFFCLNKASKYYDCAIANFKHIFKNKNENLSRSYFVKGLMYSMFIFDRNAEAVKWFRKSIDAAIPLNDSGNVCESVSDKQDLIQILIYFEKTLWALSQKTNEDKFLYEAYSNALKSVKIWEKMMYEFQSMDKNKLLNTYYINPLQFAAEYAYELYGKSKKYEYLNVLFELSEKAKYYSLFKTMQQANSNLLNLQNEYFIQKYQSVIQRKEILQDKQLFSYYCNNESECVILADSLKEIENILQVFENYLQKRYSDYYSANCRLKVSDIPNIQSNIANRNTAIIEYYVINTFSKEYTIAITITKDTCFISNVLFSNDVMIKHYQELRTSIQNSNYNNYVQEAYFLYKNLVFPSINPLNNIDKIIFIPDITMSSIPFDALITDTLNNNKDYRRLSYMVNKYHISVQLSANMMNFLNEHTTLATSKDALFISPEFQTNNFSRLVFSKECVKKLSLDFQGKSLQNNQATKRNFLAYSEDCKIIHIATHSYINDLEPNKSKLYFSQYCLNDTNNCLTLSDIYSRPIKTELVILNACETNLGFKETGEGIISFPRAFLMSGSKSVLSTLWKTDDQSSSDIIYTFYEELNKQLEKDDALRNAKIKYLEKAKTSDDANPLYWAGFIIIGNNQPILLNTISNTINIVYYALIVGFILCMLFVVLKKRKLF